MQAHETYWLIQPRSHLVWTNNFYPCSTPSSISLQNCTDAALVAGYHPDIRDEFSRYLSSAWDKVAYALHGGVHGVRNQLAKLGFLVFQVQLQHLHCRDSPGATRPRAHGFRCCPSPFRLVGCQSVSMTLHHVAQTFVLANHGDPQSELLYSPKLGLAFVTQPALSQLYKNNDPAPKPQLALPISVIEDVMQHEDRSRDPKDEALADLVALAFFFLLLRVGEYTPSGNRNTRTTQIRRKDLHFGRKRANGSNFSSGVSRRPTPGRLKKNKKTENPILIIRRP